eukprot:TRINITY_DN10590_c0_g1_i3.p1 TRINITY_DN10590_c0_g1~~TRINITY_DN10590_c0_g1_i3.p1  ORF type:complete len:209 (-),score=66.95 TRINITY_DN10590_c0_g1_i3:133-759(-)
MAENNAPGKAEKIFEEIESQLNRYPQSEELKKSAEQKPTKTVRQVVCTYWLKGICKKGEECEYLHQNDKEKLPDCPSFAYGICISGDRCPFRHAERYIYKEKNCPFYDKGFCKNGNNCRHTHEPKQICPNYLYGFCPEGPNCSYAHPQSPISEEDDTLERLAWLIDFKKLWPASYMPIWNMDHVCHKCGETGHSYKECPFAHLEISKR